MLAFSKEHNAIVERANSEVMRHLTAIIFDKRVSEAWSTDYLPLVQRIMNAKVHDTIGVSCVLQAFIHACSTSRSIDIQNI